MGVERTDASQPSRAFEVPSAHGYRRRRAELADDAIVVDVRLEAAADRDRREYVLDLTGLIARSRHFAPLMEDADTFAKIDIVDDGIGVAWPVETKWVRNPTQSGH